MGLTNWRW